MKKTVKKYFYFISPYKYSISDPELAESSDRIIDVKIHDLANNTKALMLLNLPQLYTGSNGIYHTYESRAKWFCGYFSSMERPRNNDMYENLLSNPTVRILVTDLILFDGLARCILGKTLDEIIKEKEYYEEI